MDIVDKILGAVDRVKGAVATVKDALGVSSLSDSIEKSRNAIDRRLEATSSIMALARADQAKITVDIKNAPRGTTVTTDPRSTANVDYSVGHQMGLAP